MNFIKTTYRAFSDNKYKTKRSASIACVLYNIYNALSIIGDILLYIFRMICIGAFSLVLSCVLVYAFNTPVFAEFLKEFLTYSFEEGAGAIRFIIIILVIITIIVDITIKFLIKHKDIFKFDIYKVQQKDEFYELIIHSYEF